MRVRHAEMGKDSTWGLGLDLFVAMASLVSFYLVATSIGKVRYGEFAALYAVLAPIGTLAGAGPALALLQRTVRDGASPQKSLSDAIGFQLVVAVVATPIAVLVVDSVTDSFSIVPLLCIVVSELVLGTAYLVAGACVQALQGFRAKVRLQFLPHATRLALVVILRLADELTLQNYFVLHLVCGVPLLVIAVRRLSKIGVRPIPSWPGADHLRIAFTLAIGLFALGVMTDGDKLILAASDRAAEGGLYTAAYRLVSVALVPVGAIVGASHNRFLSDGQRPDVLWSRSIRYCALTAAFGVTAGLALMVGSPLVPRLLGQEYAGSDRYIVWLAPLVALRAISAFPVNGLLGTGSLGWRTALILVSAVISVGVYSALIPRYGADGAAIGTLVSEVALAVGAWVLLYRKTRISRPDPAAASAASAASATSAESPGDHAGAASRIAW